MREEIAEVMGADSVPATFETASRLVYAGAVANETMRHRPVAPVLMLEANQTCLLGDIEVPKGTGVTVLVRPQVLDDANFKDARAFRPERWLPGAAAPHDPSVHMPFGSGPRLCPGRALALLEMKLVLATLYGAFDIERNGASSAVRERFMFIMNPVGLEVSVRKRVRSAEC